jgi:hypothetical protein
MKLFHWLKKVFTTDLTKPRTCQHPQREYRYVSHYNQVSDLSEFKPLYWEFNTQAQVDGWISEGLNYARVMQIHNCCTTCGDRRGVGHVLMNPFYRSAEETEKSRQAIAAVVRMIVPPRQQ